MNPWRTTPPCSVEECLTDPAPRTGPGTRARRYAGLGATLGAALAMMAFPRTLRRPVAAGWARSVTRAVGVRLDLRLPAGEDVTGAIGGDAAGSGANHSGANGSGALIVANHVSWLDVPLLLAYRPSLMVAKRELVGYPVIESLAARAGTISLDRDRLMSLPGVVARVAAELRASVPVTVFPEAATWCGRTVGEFYPAFFQAAIDAGVPVRPVALRYHLEGTTPDPTGPVSTRPAFVGVDTLMPSVRRVVATRGIVAQVIPLPEISSTGRDRRTLARMARDAIAGALRSADPASHARPPAGHAAPEGTGVSRSAPAAAAD